MAVWIGTCGWNYPHWGNGVFYPRGLPASDWLAFYAARFPAVEINSTFYHLPSSEVLRRWRNTTPTHFRFSAKASRFITHMKKLTAPEIHAARFLGRISELGEKLAAVLFQLPPFWTCNKQRLAEFAAYLAGQKILPGLRFAIEFRNQSWIVPPSLEILRQHGIALVHSDPPGLRIPRTATAGFLYLRRHRPEYTDRAMENEAIRIHQHSLGGRDTLCFFNNDARCAAILDAECLTRCLNEKRHHGRGSGSPSPGGERARALAQARATGL